MLCPPSAALSTQQMADLKSVLAAADKEVRDALAEEAYAFEDTRIELIVGLRYRGQTHQLDIAFPDTKPTAAKWADCVARFEKEYENLFGKGAGYREAGFEVTYVGATGTGVLPDLEPARARDKFVKKGSRAVVFDNPKKPVKTPIYEIEFPASGQKLSGPCIVEYPGHTVVMPPKSQGRTDKFGNLHVRIGA